MSERLDDKKRFGGIFLILLALAISVLFLDMIRPFLEALLLAAVFAGMLYGVNLRIAGRLGGRRVAASVSTVVVFVLVLVVPLSLFLSIVVGQAVEVSNSVGPWIEKELSQPQELDRFLQRLPFWETIQPYQDLISAKIAEFAGRLGTFLVGMLAAASRGTAAFFFNLFIMLYAMFFFLLHGREYLSRALYYVPLEPADENRLVGRFVSVTRATIKGTLVIGVVQGSLGGVAFWIAGINGWAFWSVIMMVLSIIPGVGTALVWLPAVVYLFAVGRAGTAIGLGVWCALVVGMVDNFLRPRLVGRDTQMSDLLVLVSTLGGILLFGASGFIIGPLVAALFTTVWEIYGDVFADFLPAVRLPEIVAGGAGSVAVAPEAPVAAPEAPRTPEAESE